MEPLINKALTEGFNTTIQALKATAKGCRNFENFRTVILFYCGLPKAAPEGTQAPAREPHGSEFLKLQGAGSPRTS